MAVDRGKSVFTRKHTTFHKVTEQNALVNNSQFKKFYSEFKSSLTIQTLQKYEQRIAEIIIFDS